MLRCNAANSSRLSAGPIIGSDSGILNATSKRGFFGVLLVLYRIFGITFAMVRVFAFITVPLRKLFSNLLIASICKSIIPRMSIVLSRSCDKTIGKFRLYWKTPL